MNVHNLELGATYKNYKALCQVLGEKPKTGTAKIAQFKEWECYFSYTKQGHKFIINKIFSQPKEKNDRRKSGNNSDNYITTIEKLILDLLVQEEHKGKVFLSRNKLLKELKMINENYSFCRYKTLSLSKFMCISREEIEDFYTSSSSTLKRNLETALNNLLKQSLIFWVPALTVCFVDTAIEVNEQGDIKATRYTIQDTEGNHVYTYDTVIPDKQLVHRKATEEEIKLIMHTEREVLKEYRCKNKSDIFKRKKAKEFFKEVNEILFEKANISYYYNSYEILFNEDHILEKWQELEELLLKQDERNREQELLNESVTNKINKNAASRHKKALKELEQSPDSEKNKIRGDNYYLLNSQRLTDTLIHKDALSIRKHFHE